MLMKQSCNTALFLRDYSTQDTKWDSDRARADRVAKIYAGDQQFMHRGERMLDCSQRLLFAPKVSRLTGEMKISLRYGEFCHVPFCPVCSRRRSLRWMRRLWEALPVLFAERPTASWVFLTLTVKNPPVKDLRETLKRMNAAWNRLILRKEFAPVLGWLRTTEITFGKVAGGVAGCRGAALTRFVEPHRVAKGCPLWHKRRSKTPRFVYAAYRACVLAEQKMPCIQPTQ
jgi:hypothetical protein